ncbi:hypothetical protein [Photobacterium leiognathi]|uniref:hypothetical protein n=1 Tax=Photobacterium leiognathi TaxID=553611 RepID=UPI0029814802|nr:hypothetical protein [Photobacterium leiognathi]
MIKSFDTYVLHEDGEQTFNLLDLFKLKAEEKRLSFAEINKQIENLMSEGSREKAPSDERIRRIINGDTPPTIFEIYYISRVVLGPILTEYYIPQVVENNIPIEVYNMISGENERKKRNKLKMLLSKSRESEDSHLLFSTEEHIDLLLSPQYKDGKYIYMGRTKGGKKDFPIPADDVIDFIKSGGRVRAKSDDIPLTVYGMQSISQKAGKIKGLISVGNVSNKRTVILGEDCI